MRKYKPCSEKKKTNKETNKKDLRYLLVFFLVGQRLNKLLISELVEKDRDVNGLVSDPKKEATNENDALIASSV